MPITLNDNIQSNAPKPLDNRSGKFVAGVWQPYSSVAEANSLINPAYRYKGMSIFIDIAGVVTEYWYKQGVTDVDLVTKEIAGSVSSVNSKTGSVTLTKSDIGLANVQNIDTTNPANITQNASYRFATDTEKSVWNAKQNALGFTPVPNTLTINGNPLTGNITLDKISIGLGNVDNTSDATKNSAVATLTNKTISGANNTFTSIPQAAITNLTTDLSNKASATALSSHTTNTGNPHLVTKAQVGLGNVDNTSDLDKPISTATQTALNAKADLGLDGKVPSSQLPANGSYKGTWDASTNTPTITSGTGTNGDYYRVSVAGTTTIDGISSWAVGDEIRFNGTAWQKIPNSSAVSSVAGKTGVVTLDKNDVGLTNVDNTTDLNKPVSTATQSALDLKAPLNSPTFTGTPSAPTPTTSDSSTKIATTATIDAKIIAQKNAANGIAGLDSLGKINADIISDGTTNKAYTATEKTKLSGIATGATANQTDTYLLSRGNHTGTQSADTIIDGTTNKAYTATEQTKLAGIASGATANSTDAQLRDRSTHTGTQLATTISDFSTAADARITAAKNIANGIAGLDASAKLSSDYLIDGTTNKVFTSTEKTKLAAITGTNTGDETAATIRTKIGAASATNDGYLAQADWSIFNAKASISSPTFTGTPAAPTAVVGTNTTQLATTAFVRAEADNRISIQKNVASGIAGLDASAKLTADILVDGTTNKVLTSAEKTLLSNTSGTNTGDETLATIKTKLGAATNSVDGYLTATDWNTFNSKATPVDVSYLTLTYGATTTWAFSALRPQAQVTTTSSNSTISVTGTVDGDMGCIVVTYSGAPVITLPGTILRGSLNPVDGRKDFLYFQVHGSTLYWDILNTPAPTTTTTTSTTSSTTTTTTTLAGGEQVLTFSQLAGTISESPSGTWNFSAGAQGLGNKSLPASTDGYYVVDIPTRSNSEPFMAIGFDTTNASGDLGTYDYTIYLENGEFKRGNNGSLTATGVFYNTDGSITPIASIAGAKMRLRRSGTSIIGEFYNGTAWSTIYTWTSASTAILYTKANSYTQAKILVNPKVSSAFV